MFLISLILLTFLLTFSFILSFNFFRNGRWDNVSFCMNYYKFECNTKCRGKNHVVCRTIGHLDNHKIDNRKSEHFCNICFYKK